MSFNDLLKLNGCLLSTLRGRRVGMAMCDPFFSSLINSNSAASAPSSLLNQTCREACSTFISCVHCFHEMDWFGDDFNWLLISGLSDHARWILTRHWWWWAEYIPNDKFEVIASQTWMFRLNDWVQLGRKTSFQNRKKSSEWFRLWRREKLSSTNLRMTNSFGV